MDIKQLIGETTEYDKKEKLEARRPKSWCKSISAFANSFGGTLVFGVTNDDEFAGIPEAEKDAELISELIKAQVHGAAWQRFQKNNDGLSGTAQLYGKTKTII